MTISGRVRRYLDATPEQRAALRRWQVRRITGRPVSPAVARLQEWERLRDSGREFALVTIREPLVVQVGDEFIGRSVFMTGEFELDTVESAIRRLSARPRRTLVDVGANIGTVCIPAVRRGWAERAIAIEPDPLNFSLLTANVALNGLLDVVERHRRAAAPTSGQHLQLARSTDNLGDHRIASDRVSHAALGDRVDVETVALDDIAPDLSPTSDLVVIDVQGFEAQVLRGATALVERRIPLVIEFWPEGLDAHGGLSELSTMLEPYRSFVDLGQRDGVERPLSQLPALHDRLRAAESHTDLLLT